MPEEGVPIGGVSAAATVVSVVMKAYEMKQTAEFRETMRKGLLKLESQLRKVLTNQEKIFHELEMNRLYVETDSAEFKINTWYNQYYLGGEQLTESRRKEFLDEVPKKLSLIDGAIRNPDKPAERWLHLAINKLYDMDLYEEATTSRCQLAYLKYSDMLNLQAKGLKLMAMAAKSEEEHSDLLVVTKNVLDRIRGTERKEIPGQAQICQEIVDQEGEKDEFLWIEPSSPGTQPYPWKYNDHSVNFGWNKPGKDPAIVQARIWSPSPGVLAPQLFTVPWEEKYPPKITDAAPEGHVQITAEDDKFRGVNKVTVDTANHENPDDFYLTGIKLEQNTYPEGQEPYQIQRQDISVSVADTGMEHTFDTRTYVDTVREASDVLWLDGGFVPRDVGPETWAPFTGIRLVRRPYKHDSSIGVVCLSLQCRWNVNNLKDWGGIGYNLNHAVFLWNVGAERYVSFFANKNDLVLSDKPTNFAFEIDFEDLDEAALRYGAQISISYQYGSLYDRSWTLVDPNDPQSTEVWIAGQSSVALMTKDGNGQPSYLSLEDPKQLTLTRQCREKEQWKFIRTIDVHCL